MNQVFDDYLQKYHQDFFNSEHNENYRLDVETNFDDTEFRRNFYEENVQNNPNFQFLEDKIGVINFEDYLDVLNFSEIDWKEYDIKPLHQKRFDRLRKDEQKAIKELKQILEKQRKDFIEERIAYRRCIGTTWKINNDRLSEIAKKALHFCSFLPSEMIMQSLLYSEDTFNAKVWQELEDSSLLSPLMNNTTTSKSCHYT